MKRVAVLLAMIGLIGLMSAGCSWFRKDTPPAPPPAPVATNTAGGMIVTPKADPIGRVTHVNENGRFVVLTFPVGTLPSSGQRLYVYRQGLKVGELKVTGPQEQENTVADIVNGEAQTGDEIRYK